MPGIARGGITAIAPLLKSEDPVVRQAAVRALGKAGPQAGEFATDIVRSPGTPPRCLPEGFMDEAALAPIQSSKAVKKPTAAPFRSFLMSVCVPSL